MIQLSEGLILPVDTDYPRALLIFPDMLTVSQFIWVAASKWLNFEVFHVQRLFFGMNKNGNTKVKQVKTE